LSYLQYSYTDGLRVTMSAGFRRKVSEHGKRREVTSWDRYTHYRILMQGVCNACSFWEGHMDDEASFSHITFAYQDM